MADPYPYRRYGMIDTPTAMGGGVAFRPSAPPGSMLGMPTQQARSYLEFLALQKKKREAEAAARRQHQILEAAPQGLIGANVGGGEDWTDWVAERIAAEGDAGGHADWIAEGMGPNPIALLNASADTGKVDHMLSAALRNLGETIIPSAQAADVPSAERSLLNQGPIPQGTAGVGDDPIEWKWVWNPYIQAEVRVPANWTDEQIAASFEAEQAAKDSAPLLEQEAVEADSPGFFGELYESIGSPGLFRSSTPTQLGDSAYADSMIASGQEAAIAAQARKEQSERDMAKLKRDWQEQVTLEEMRDPRINEQYMEGYPGSFPYTPPRERLSTIIDETTPGDTELQLAQRAALKGDLVEGDITRPIKTLTEVGGEVVDKIVEGAPEFIGDDRTGQTFNRRTQEWEAANKLQEDIAPTLTIEAIKDIAQVGDSSDYASTPEALEQQASTTVDTAWSPRETFPRNIAQKRQRYLNALNDIFTKAMILNVIAEMTGTESNAEFFVKMALAKMDAIQKFDGQERLENLSQVVFFDADGKYSPPLSKQDAYNRVRRSGGSQKEAEHMSGHLGSSDQTSPEKNHLKTLSLKRAWDQALKKHGEGSPQANMAEWSYNVFEILSKQRTGELTSQNLATLRQQSFKNIWGTRTTDGKWRLPGDRNVAVPEGMWYHWINGTIPDSVKTGKKKWTKDKDGFYVIPASNSNAKPYRLPSWDAMSQSVLLKDVKEINQSLSIEDGKPEEDVVVEEAATSPEDQWILYGSKVVATPEEEATLPPGTVYKRLDTGDTFYVQQQYGVGR